MATIVHKRGDTFSRTCTYKRDGVAYNLTGTTIAATIKDSSGATIDMLTATLLTQSGATLGQFTLTKAYAATASWAIGTHQFDIQYTFPDATRISSGTVALQVVEDITP